MSGTLPNWIARLLGEEVGPGEGTAWSLQHRWPWPPWITLLLLAFAMVFVIAIYLRECRRTSGRYRVMLAAIRLALVGIALLMIAQLTLSLKRTGLPYVAVLLDDSESMTIADRYDDQRRAKLEKRIRQTGGELSRWNLAKVLLTEREGKLPARIAGQYKLRVYFLEDSPGGARPSGAAGVEELLQEIEAIQKPTVKSTRLGAALHTILDELRGTAPAAIVLLTDGVNTDGRSLREAALLAVRRGVPLFAVGIGSDQPVRDLKLTDLLVDDVVFLNDVVNFECRLTGDGFEGSKVRIVLREQGKPDVLAETEVTVGGGGKSQQVRLPYRLTKAGKFRYVVEVGPQEGELKTDNNRVGRTVEVRKEQIRVLLVQAYPNYEFRYLRHMLQRDETIELNWVLQEADTEYAQQDHADDSMLPVFPVSREKLFSYDVIILGDVNPARLTDSMMRNLVDFVDQDVVHQQGKGGGLMLIAGPEYMPWAYRETPLARLMPIQPDSIRYPSPDQAITEGFQVQTTEPVLANPPMQLGDTLEETRTIWRELPPLYWLLEVHQLKPAARVLAEHPTRPRHDGQPLPVICMQYVGAGKVVFHATDETWRWRRRVGDVFFARYWIQMIRYLSRSKLSGDRSVKLTVNRRDGKYRQGEPVRLSVEFTDERLAPAEHDGVTVVLEHQGHKTRRIRLRRVATGHRTFEGVVSRPPVGETHAWMAIPRLEDRTPAIDFEVKPRNSEFEDPQMDAAALRWAAENTKGRFYTFEEADRLLSDLPPGQQVPIEPLHSKTLWNKWPVLFLFLVLLVTEWILRKMGGMV